VNGLHLVLANVVSFSLSQDSYMEGYWRAELKVNKGVTVVVIAASRRGPLRALLAMLDDLRDEFQF